MSNSFREYLQELREHDELLEISRPTDLRNMAALVPQSEKAVLFQQPKGYAIPVASGLLQSRNRLAIAAGVPYGEIQQKLQKAMINPIEPEQVEDAPVKSTILKGSEVDLYRLPVPIFSVLDGGPMITAGIVIAEDPDHGLNAGMYRLMLHDKSTTGIDIVTPNNLRGIAERAFATNSTVPISISIGTHPCQMIAATFKAPLGVNELTYAGGLSGAPLRLASGVTVPVPCIADAEIVLEGEIIPDGWVYPEGPFGEFTRLMGGLHYNPRVKINALMYRDDPTYYALHMPWENIWMSAPIYEAAAWRVLGEAGVKATAICLTPGGCCHWHIVAAIQKRPGDGKNAIAALLSIADIKHVVVTDGDIDIFDPVEVEWAIATRVQADRDTVILSNARSKPLDPSLAPTAGIPTTAKMGIDATIPENVPPERYQRIVYFNQEKVSIESACKETQESEKSTDLQATPRTPSQLAQEILQELGRKNMSFADLLEHFSEEPFGVISRAIGGLNERRRITQDEKGCYQIFHAPE